MKRTTKLLALAATAAAMSFGATAAWANLIGLSAITGCAAKGVVVLPGPIPGEVQRQADVCTGNSLFGGDGTAADDGSFSYQTGTLVVKADFGTVGDLDTFTLTLTNTNNATGAAAAAGIDSGTVMFFGNLIAALGGQEHVESFTDYKMVVTKNDGTGTPNDVTATLLGQVYDIAPGETTKDPKVGASGDWFMLDFSDAAQKVPGAKMVTISATIVRAPEPGSLALLGALLVAFGVIRIGRARGSLGGRAS